MWRNFFRSWAGWGGRRSRETGTGFTRRSSKDPSWSVGDITSLKNFNRDLSDLGALEKTWEVSVRRGDLEDTEIQHRDRREHRDDSRYSSGLTERIISPGFKLQESILRLVAANGP